MNVPMKALTNILTNERITEYNDVLMNVLTVV